MRALLILPDTSADPSVCVWDTFHVCVLVRHDETLLTLCPAASLDPCDHAECRTGRVIPVELPPALEAELRTLAARALASGPQ